MELQEASKLGMEPAVLVKWKGNNSTHYDGRSEYVRVSDLTERQLKWCGDERGESGRV